MKLKLRIDCCISLIYWRIHKDKLTKITERSHEWNAGMHNDGIECDGMVRLNEWANNEVEWAINQWRKKERMAECNSMRVNSLITGAQLNQFRLSFSN